MVQRELGALDDHVVRFHFLPARVVLLHLARRRQQHRMHFHRFQQWPNGVRKDDRMLNDHVIAKVRNEVAWIHAVESLEKGGQTDLEVNELIVGEPRLVLAVPGGQVEEHLEEIAEVLGHRGGDDREQDDHAEEGVHDDDDVGLGLEERQKKRGNKNVDDNLILKHFIYLQQLEDVAEQLMAGDLVQPRRMLLDDVPEQRDRLIAQRRVQNPFGQAIENEFIVRRLDLDEDVDDARGVGLTEVVHHAVDQP